MGNKQSPQKHHKPASGRYDYRDYNHSGPPDLYGGNSQQRNGYLATYNAPAPIADDHVVRRDGLELVSM